MAVGIDHPYPDDCDVLGGGGLVAYGTHNPQTDTIHGAKVCWPVGTETNRRNGVPLTSIPAEHTWGCYFTNINSSASTRVSLIIFKVVAQSEIPLATRTFYMKSHAKARAHKPQKPGAKSRPKKKPSSGKKSRSK